MSKNKSPQKPVSYVQVGDPQPPMDYVLTTASTKPVSPDWEERLEEATAGFITTHLSTFKEILKDFIRAEISKAEQRGFDKAIREVLSFEVKGFNPDGTEIKSNMITLYHGDIDFLLSQFSATQKEDK